MALIFLVLGSIIGGIATVNQAGAIGAAGALIMAGYRLNEGRKGLGEPVTVDSEWLVKTDEARGHLACPWEDGIFRKINVTVERKDTGEKLFYTDLSVHLLEAHGFLEGRGSSFRLNLESVKHVLKV